MMRKLISLFLLVSMCFLGTSCALLAKNNADSNVPECNIGQSVAFANGVEFSVVQCFAQAEIKTSLGTHTAERGNKYVILTIRVANNSKNAFEIDGTNIWLDREGATIRQINLVKRFDNAYYSISQSPTTVMDYIALFQVGEQVNLTDLALVIDNGDWLNNEKVKIWLE